MRVLPLTALLVGALWSTTALAVPPGLPIEFIQAQNRAPLAGTPAPDFTLKKLGSDEVVTLSTMTGRPVVLVFGSYT